MSQCSIAGFTSYENQSLTDIVGDICKWIDYSNEVAEFIETTITEVKSTDFYRKIHCDYMSFIYEAIQICKTNVEDFKIVLRSIENHNLTKKNVELFLKIGNRAIANSDDNKRYFRSGDERWHDYEDTNFKKIEKIYAEFGDYSATLWDVTNAASRLKDYIDIPQEVSTMKIEDNSIKIGDGNSINNSVIGNSNEVENMSGDVPGEKITSKLMWYVVVPIIVSVIATAICVWLGIQN